MARLRLYTDVEVGQATGQQYDLYRELATIAEKHGAGPKDLRVTVDFRGSRPDVVVWDPLLNRSWRSWLYRGDLEGQAMTEELLKRFEEWAADGYK